MMSTTVKVVVARVKSDARLIQFLSIQNWAERADTIGTRARASKTRPSSIHFCSRLDPPTARPSLISSLYRRRRDQAPPDDRAPPMWQKPEIDCFNFRASSAAARYDALPGAAEKTWLTASYGLRREIIRLSVGPGLALCRSFSRAGHLSFSAHSHCWERGRPPLGQWHDSYPSCFSYPCPAAKIPVCLVI